MDLVSAWDTDPDGTLTTDDVLRIYEEIARACARAGLRPPDAEEVAQDIWEWLLRTGNVNLARQTRWLGAVAQNFLRRFWRRSHRRRFREGARPKSGFEPRWGEAAQELERKEALDHVSQALPDKERQLLTLIRFGHTLAEAARILKIPRGSRTYYRGRLVEHARRETRRLGPHRGA